MFCRMKYYRLSEGHARYGVAGHVIPYNQWLNIPYYDRALFDKVEEGGRGYAYKIELSHRGATPSLYYQDDYPAMVVFLSAISAQAQAKDTEQRPVLVPKSSAVINYGVFTITITYREEWDTNSTT